MSTFEKLVDAIGRPSAEKLIAEFGGRRIYVPVRAEPDSPIATAVGIESARTLSRLFGGERIRYTDISWPAPRASCACAQMATIPIRSPASWAARASAYIKSWPFVISHSNGLCDPFRPFAELIRNRAARLSSPQYQRLPNSSDLIARFKRSPTPLVWAAGCRCNSQPKLRSNGASWHLA